MVMPTTTTILTIVPTMILTTMAIALLKQLPMGRLLQSFLKLEISDKAPQEFSTWIL